MAAAPIAASVSPTTTCKTLAEAKKGRANLQIDNGDPGYDAILEGTARLLCGGRHRPRRDHEHLRLLRHGRRPARNSSRGEFAARDWPFGGVRVFDDIDIAHAGSLGGEDGAVIIAGTGSAALAMVDGPAPPVRRLGVPDRRPDERRDPRARADPLSPSRRPTGWCAASPLTEAVLALLGGSNAEIMDWSFGNAYKLHIVDEHGRDGSDDPELQELLERFSVGAARPSTASAACSSCSSSTYEKGDPVARQLMDSQMSYVDNYVNWFKARGATTMAVVGGFADRLFPLLAGALRRLRRPAARRAARWRPHSRQAAFPARMNYLDRRLGTVSSRIIPVQPFDYVVFGATGDLTKRKLIPALYHRFKDGQFDEHLAHHRRVALKAQRRRFPEARARPRSTEFVETEYQDKKIIDRFVVDLLLRPPRRLDEATWGDLKQERCATIPRSSAPSISPSRPTSSGRPASTSPSASTTAATPAS